MKNVYEKPSSNRVYYTKEVDRTFAEINPKVGNPPNPAIDPKVLGEAISEILKMNGGRILEVKITLSDNIYRVNPELNQILRFVPESKFQRKEA